ncbi:hypothetical protein MNBD_GAMMA05-1789 [hydrothermal vent metagenome]|uniref:DUF4124 domain-containing protein n=1 Tax=hydrothermal vent metagenome TaxID=652676 RepID=A0A3B0WVW4_9ZZZZ
MKFLIFKMLVTLGILITMPLIYMGKIDPVPYFDSLFGGGMPDISALKSKVPTTLSNVVSDEKVQVYKWRDKNGVMQFSNTPPPTGSRAEQLEIDPNSNLMQAVKIPVEEEPEEVAKTERPNPYSAGGMKKALDAAKDVEDMMKKRQEKQMEMLGNI